MNEIEGIPVGRVLVISGGKSRVNDILIQLALEHNLNIEIAEMDKLKQSIKGISFDSMWIDALQAVDSDDKPTNSQYGPQPKGKKGKVRKW
jgi:hypothetical protein